MIRNILAVIAGVIVGGLINGSLVAIGHQIVPPPPGVDLTSAAGWTQALPLLKAQHFIFPFLAHALGTFFGSMLAVIIAASHKHIVAMIIGIIFLCGGIAAALMIPAPTWFILIDLVFAYTPMAWLGGRLIGAGKN